MKTKSIIIVFVCVLAAAFALGATGVVKLGSNEKTLENDRLIGILVTTEYLDLYGEELSYSQILVPGSTSGLSEHQGRLYGQLADCIDYADDGTPIHSKEYVFPDSGGIFCYSVTIDDDFGKPYTTTGGEGVISSHLNINSSDDGEEVLYECTVGVNAKAQTELNFNPVYITPDGEVYAENGDAFFYGGGAEGDVYCITLSEDHTFSENGSESTERFSIAVQTRYVYSAQTVSIIQLDSASAVLSRAEYAVDDLPESLAPASDTAYIVVESNAVGLEGEPVTNRSIYQPADCTAEVYSDRGDGICVPVSVVLEW